MDQKKVPLFFLITLVISIIVNINEPPSVAIFGSSLIAFFVLSALIFLIPTALVSAELSAAFPEKGGIYQWVAKAFGENYALIAIWLQWVAAMIWLPTIFSFIAGAAAYLINPDLAHNQIYTIICVLILTWGLTLLNLRGFRLSIKFIHISAIIGTIIPISLLIILGISWVVSGQPIQTQFDHRSLIPSFSSLDDWAALVTIMFFFEGMELAGVHVNDVSNPQTNFPKAIFIGSLFSFFAMALSSFSIASVLSKDDIHNSEGVMQLFEKFLTNFGLESLMPILTIAIIVGSIGGIVNWLISPAKGLLNAAEFGFLPSFFSKKNKAGIASAILIAEALMISGICLVFPFDPDAAGFRWFLIALSIELYMMMYVLMFLAGLRLHYTHKNRPPTFKIPGGSWGIWSVTLIGIFGCMLTIIVSFFPPDTIFIRDSMTFIYMMAIGNFITLSPLFIFYLYKKKRAPPTPPTLDV